MNSGEHKLAFWSLCPHSALLYSRHFIKLVVLRGFFALLACRITYNSLQPLWTVAHQAPVSMGFPRQEYWSRLPFPSPRDLPNPGMEPVSPTLQADSLPLSHLRSQSTTYWSVTHFTKLDFHKCNGGNTLDCVNNLHLRGLSHTFWYFNYNFSSHNIVL